MNKAHLLSDPELEEIDLLSDASKKARKIVSTVKRIVKLSSQRKGSLIIISSVSGIRMYNSEMVLILWSHALWSHNVYYGLIMYTMVSHN